MTRFVVDRSPRGLVVVSGPDATSFLQSLVSQDLDPIAVGSSAHALLLQPQGKLIVDFYTYRRAADTWWCLCEAGFGDALAAGLNRFKIRVKVDVRVEPVTVTAVRGASADGDAVIPVTWGGAPAVDVIDARPVDAPMIDAAAYERARIEAGVPRMGAELDEKTIPQEAFLDEDAVSFTKGCFVGQELVCRIDTRGHVNRMLRRLRAPGGLAPGADVTYDDKTVGTITSSAGDVALAMLRREVEPGTVVAVAGAPATVESTTG